MVRDRTCGWAGCKFVTVDLRAFQTHLFLHAGQILQRCQWKGCKSTGYSAEMENYWHLLRAHTEIRGYYCGNCDKQFHSPVLLKLHERKVHGRRKKDIFDCAYLDCAFTSLTGVLMKQHLAYVHSNPYVFESVLQTSAIRTLLPNSPNPQLRVIQEFDALISLKIKQEPGAEEEILLSSDEEDVVMTSADSLNSSKCIARPMEQSSDIIHGTSGAPLQIGNLAVKLDPRCVKRDALGAKNVNSSRKNNCSAPRTSSFQSSSSDLMGNINLDKRVGKSTIAEGIDFRTHSKWTDRAGNRNRTVQYFDNDLRPASEINNNVYLEVNLVRPEERVDVDVYINPQGPSPPIIRHEENCISNGNEPKSAKNPVSSEPSAPVQEKPAKRKRGRHKKEGAEEKKARLAAEKQAAAELKKAAEEEREAARKKEAERQKEMENNKKKVEKKVSKSNPKPIPTSPFVFKKANLTKRIPKIKVGAAANYNHDFRSPLAAKQYHPPPTKELHMNHLGANKKGPSTSSPNSESSLKENADRIENRPRMGQKRPSFGRPKKPIFKPKRNAPCPNGGVMDLLDQQLGDSYDGEEENESESEFSMSASSVEGSASMNPPSFSKSSDSMEWETPAAISPLSDFSTPISSPPHREERGEAVRSRHDEFGRDSERRPKRVRWDRRSPEIRSKSSESMRRPRTPERRRLETLRPKIYRFDGVGNRLPSPKTLKDAEVPRSRGRTAENGFFCKNKEAERSGTSKKPAVPEHNSLLRALFATPSCNLPPPHLFPTTIVTHLLPPAPGFPPGFCQPMGPQCPQTPVEITGEPLFIPPPPPPPLEKKGAGSGGKYDISNKNRRSSPPKPPNTERLGNYRRIRVATSKRYYKMKNDEYRRHLQRKPPSRPFLPNIPMEVNQTLKDPRRPHLRL